VIVVVGRMLATGAHEPGVAGLAAAIALAAAARGATVELVAKLGDDPLGDAALFALTRANVGHAAILRDPARPTPVVPPPADEGTGPPDDDWLAEPDGLDRQSAPEPVAAGLELAAGDLELALRYLTDASVIVLADPASPWLVPVAVDGAAFAEAALIVVGDPVLPAAELAATATVLSLPATDPDGLFAALVADYAVFLDAGQAPAQAWASATGRLGVERA